MELLLIWTSLIQSTGCCSEGCNIERVKEAGGGEAGHCQGGVQGQQVRGGELLVTPWIEGTALNMENSFEISVLL